MHSLDLMFLGRQPLNLALLQTVRRLGEFQGQEALFVQRSPQILETLSQSSIIESTESSNRMEGVTAKRERIQEIVMRQAQPRTRPEQEIAGYRDVLNEIYRLGGRHPFDLDTVLRFHQMLFRYGSGTGGRWKSVDNEITETLPDGRRVTRFRAVPATETPAAMAELHRRFESMWAAQTTDRLLLIPCYVLDFLCIHPFLDGNGRTARLLTAVLLSRAGYQVGRFISMERIVEQTKTGYYDALAASSKNWHQRGHTLLPWWEYFLGVLLLRVYEEFSQRMDSVRSPKGAKRDLIVGVIEQFPAEFQYADIERACPGIGKPTIHRALAQLKTEGRVRCKVGGRDAVWQKISVP